MTSPTLLVRTDALPAIGVGHAMRALALAQEMQRRGGRVTLSGTISVDWVARAYAEAGVTRVPAAESPDHLLEQAVGLRADAVLLDGYLIGPEYGARLRSAGIRVGAMVDAEFGAAQEADVYVDQNPGFLPRPLAPGESDRTALAGASYTLFRDDVLAARAARDARVPPPPAAAASRPLRIVGVFGGTDPFGAAEVLTPLIVAAVGTRAARIDIASGDEGLEQHSSATATVRAVGAMTDLAARSVQADLVVTASGSTVWELLCIGAPTAVVCVADNQAPGYEFATGGEYVAPAGHLDELRTRPEARAACIAALRETLADDGLRSRRAAAGRSLLDGRGRQRVLDALLPVSPPEN